jgi:hypothetical protein
MVKIKFKIDTIWLRLIVLKFVYYIIYVTDDVEEVSLYADVVRLHVKKMTCSGFHLYSYSWYTHFTIVYPGVAVVEPHYSTCTS